MRFCLILLTLITAGNVFSCDEKLRDYIFECQYQDKFNNLKNDFSKYEKNPLSIKGHLLPHVLGNKDYYANKNEYLNHSKEHLKSNQTWQTWTKMQNYITKLNPMSISITDIVKLQSKLINSKSSGRLRIGNAEINPSIMYSCEDDKINNDVIYLINNYDLMTEEGYPLLKLENISECKNSKNLKSGKIIFYKNAAVRSELNRWVVDFNDTLQRYENKETLDISPYQYLSDMRRWFMAISPFSEAVYILNKSSDLDFSILVFIFVLIFSLTFKIPNIDIFLCVSIGISIIGNSLCQRSLVGFSLSKRANPIFKSLSSPIFSS